MRITNLIGPKGMVYSSNVYLVLGSWSAIEDVNTLVDVGNDVSILEQLKTMPTGVGKRSVEQVILTHSHFDHMTLLPAIRALYHPVVYAYSPFIGADVIVQDGQILRCGDRFFEVIYTPGHSDDSICLYCQTDGTLFVGDTPVIVRSTDGTHEERFVNALERLCEKDVRAIYFGHGDPILENCHAILAESLQNVHQAMA